MALLGESCAVECGDTDRYLASSAHSSDSPAGNLQILRVEAHLLRSIDACGVRHCPEGLTIAATIHDMPPRLLVPQDSMRGT